MPHPSTAKAFEFSPEGIASVLKLNKLAVPPYQREYAWSVEEVKQLFTDLANAKFGNHDYFLGTIVTIPASEGDALEIVDGQQRLTSTALFLAAMRNYLKTLPSTAMIVESIENEFLTTIDRRAGSRVPRLRLNVDDNEFFLRLTAADPAAPAIATRESHRRLEEAFREAHAAVKRLVAPVSEAEHAAQLNDWLEFLEHSATVILLKAPDGAQAFRMFETLNDRGLKTSQVDLVKSYLFGQANRRIAEAQAKWSSMRNMLEEIDDSDRGINFLRHLLIASREFTRADDVYSTVQKSVRGEAVSITFLSDLEQYSRLYVATFRADSEQWGAYPAEAIAALQVLNQFDIKPLRPLILAVTKAFAPAEAAKALSFLVSFAVRLLIASTTRSGSIEESIAATALSVWEGTTSSTALLKASMAKIVPDDRVFQEAFATTSSSKADFARYYLRSLEKAFNQDPEPWTVVNDDPAQITLEHIIPKTPRLEEWTEFDAETHPRYVRRLGNMCLLQRGTNSNARSDRFDDKRAVYLASPLHWTSTVGGLAGWSPAVIDSRQAEMAKLAVKAWPI
ncbi:DUF262 domain-containing HNH endonuclease family protein [Phenylobacterium sp.]|uniref:DUF262 domain-containing protein n=1 Tax=Phenylobacterium sp. TaxID=1871053 RepID=UPI0025DFD8DD|nr:DUF262 domain-containing HNH endonuclease family protein [Phenylobacterium sp.]